MRILVSLFLLFTTVTITAQPGTLDNTFGTGGKVVENFSAPHVEVLDAVVQTDGKIVVLADAGYHYITHIVLLRYHTNGTLDNTFSGDGIADSPLTGPDHEEYPSAIKLQADGKILVCGSAYDAPQAFVLRYHTDGSLDNSFGGTGVVYIQNSEIRGTKNLVILPNGQIVVLTGKPNFLPGATELCLVKLNSDGSLDGSFGTGGIAAMDATANTGVAYSKIELQSDGKLIVGGEVRDRYAAGGQDSVLLVRVNGNGTIDNTYGTNGVFTCNAGPALHQRFSDMAIQPDGKIIVSGYGENRAIFLYTFVTRIGTDGSSDNTFGVNGFQYIHTATTGFSSSGGLSLQADGKVLIAGFAANAPDNYTMAAARLTTSGLLDGSFDSDGTALLPVNNHNSYGIVPLQQSDGKIILAGYGGNGAALSVTIGRLTATGQTDNTINAGSTVAYIGSGSSNDGGQNILVQPDQKIINIRDQDNGYTAVIGLSRHLPDGTPDTSFGVNGRTGTDLPGYSNKTFSALLSSGKIMVVADYNDIVTGPKIGVLRFNASGFPDSTFGINGKLFFTTNNNESNDVTDAIVHPDGRTVILTPQFLDFDEGDTTLLIKLNADGSYDNTFNGTGKVALPDSLNTRYKKISVQPDGKILLERNVRIGLVYRTFLKRLNTDGTTDNSFNAGNDVATMMETNATAIQPDGKILLAGRQSKLIRLNTDGSFDVTFDGDGIAEPTYFFDVDQGVTDIKVLADGKILLSGSKSNATYSGAYFQVVSINTNGTLDASFGTGGTATATVIADNQEYNHAMALQANGKILLTGYTLNDEQYYTDFAMVRLNGSNVGTTYTFTGNGAWDVAANWSNNTIPPATLPSGNTILIDPVAGGECLLTVTQHISTGATFTVKAGKNFRVAGGLILQ